MKEKIRLIQARVGVEADGVIGPRTLEALMAALGIEERPVWPAQAQVRSGGSCFGYPGREENLVSVVPAYQLFYEGKPVRSIRVHRVIAPHVEAALREVLEH
jgi:murein L,D-transpeptidase YcbB/YkuD